MIGIVPGNVSTWQFVGPTAIVTTTANQRLTAAVQAPLGLLSGGTQSFGYDICFRSTTGGASLFNFSPSPSTGQATTTRVAWPAIATVVPGAGTWQVGFCVLNNGSGALSNTDTLNGWVQVTN